MINSYEKIKFNRIKKQLSEYTCGLAVLSTLFSYYFDIPMEEHDIEKSFLNNIINERRGISFLDMKKIIQNKKYQTYGYKVNIAALIELVKKTLVPIIVHMTQDMFIKNNKETVGHFSLLLGFEGNYFIFKDTAYGNRILSKKDFLSKFSGNILIVLPPEKDKVLMRSSKIKIKKYLDRVKKKMKRIEYYETVKH